MDKTTVEDAALHPMAARPLDTKLLALQKLAAVRAEDTESSAALGGARTGLGSVVPG